MILISSSCFNLSSTKVFDSGADLSGGRCNGRLQRTRRVEAEVDIVDQDLDIFIDIDEYIDIFIDIYTSIYLYLYLDKN